jgi:hypothetical protein
MYNKVTLVNVDNKEDNPYPIKIKLETRCCIILTKYGQYTDADFAKCVIYPKGRTTWEGFVPPCKFKDGDIITCTNSVCSYVAIFKEMNTDVTCKHYVSFTLDDAQQLWTKVNLADFKKPRFATEEEKEKLFDAIKANGYKWNEETKTLEKLVKPKFKDGDIISDSLGTCIFKGEGRIKGTVNFYCGINNDYFQVKDDKCNPNGHYGDIVDYRLATEEEKQKLFDAMKDNGYKWNAETKTLEKLIEPNEDVDDEILISGIYFDREYHADEVELHLGNYEIEIRDGRTYAVLKNQKTKTLEPKFKVGDKVKDKNNRVWFVVQVSEKHFDISSVPNAEGYFVPIDDQDNYELVPNKFDINTLVPFESKVLVRDKNTEKWKSTFWGFYDIDNAMNYPYECCGDSFAQCIPYEGNEHLLSTTNDCAKFYKTW